MLHLAVVSLVASWVAHRGPTGGLRCAADSRRCPSSCASEGSSWLQPLLKADSDVAAAAASYHKAFTELASSQEFVSETWTRRPLLLEQPIEGVAGSFTLDDVREAVDSDFLEAGLGVVSSSCCMSSPNLSSPGQPGQPESAGGF